MGQDDAGWHATKSQQKSQGPPLDFQMPKKVAHFCLEVWGTSRLVSGTEKCSSGNIFMEPAPRSRMGPAQKASSRHSPHPSLYWNASELHTNGVTLPASAFFVQVLVWLVLVCSSSRGGLQFCF